MVHVCYDFIIIVKKKENDQFSDNLINVNFFTEDEHQQRLNAHEISALECQFLAEDKILFEKRKFSFILNLNKLRHSISEKASNSWVKAKKKLTVPDSYDLNLGRKSLFHSFRIIDYGIQIAEHGKIVNYDKSNTLYAEIMNYYNWDEMFEKFKSRFNKINTEFKILAPKN
ncbi:MAG: hypothetical protein HC836_31645 [Richelia sp. RM2_1_2]|nr:hypothetical protein [Richelia sp. RM2_1_2]